MAAATTAMAPTATPALPVTTVTVAPSKKHVQKPDDFIDVKDANKFKWQIFMYTNEYSADFDTNKKQICFTLSFMKGGLPEKFAANFIDQVIDQAAVSVLYILSVQSGTRLQCWTTTTSWIFLIFWPHESGHEPDQSCWTTYATLPLISALVIAIDVKVKLWAQEDNWKQAT